MTSKEIQDAILKCDLHPSEDVTNQILEICEAINKRLNLLESRISTVQDDILRVEKNVQTLADDTSRMIAGPLPAQTMATKHYPSTDAIERGVD